MQDLLFTRTRQTNHLLARGGARLARPMDRHEAGERTAAQPSAMIIGMLRSQTETCVREGVVYRVERTWDDATGNSDIREFDPDGNLVRRCEWRIWPEAERVDQVG